MRVGANGQSNLPVRVPNGQPKCALGSLGVPIRPAGFRPPWPALPIVGDPAGATTLLSYSPSGCAGASSTAARCGEPSSESTSRGASSAGSRRTDSSRSLPKRTIATV